MHQYLQSNPAIFYYQLHSGKIHIICFTGTDHSWFWIFQKATDLLFHNITKLEVSGSFEFLKPRLDFALLDTFGSSWISDMNRPISQKSSTTLDKWLWKTLNSLKLSMLRWRKGHRSFFGYTLYWQGFMESRYLISLMI